MHVTCTRSFRLGRHSSVNKPESILPQNAKVCINTACPPSFSYLSSTINLDISSLVYSHPQYLLVLASVIFALLTLQATILFTFAFLDNSVKMSALQKRANDALNANPNHFNYPESSDINITTHGSDWYWAVTAVMAVSSIAFIGMSFTVPRKNRIFHYITGES